MSPTSDLSNVTELMEAWSDQHHRANASPGRFVSGPLGHINTEGAADAPAHSFSRHNPRFVESLEPGVRNLVVALINRFDCVTYSSCEGHCDEGWTSLTSLRSVVFLSPSHEDEEELRRGLTELAEAVRRDWAGTARPR
jgi:hypothetical protein